MTRSPSLAFAQDLNNSFSSLSINDGDKSVGRVCELPFKTLAVPPLAHEKTAELFRILENPNAPGPDGEPRTGRKKVTVKHSVFDLPQSHVKIHGWKFSDWDYRKKILPTNARGLFSIMNESTGDMEVVTRGYDKFFNVGETPETNWNWIEQNTKAPYYLTQKENGCIIFISALPDGNLLVCSKHSAGVRKDLKGSSKSHAEVGEEWIEKHLAKSGFTKRDLAATLKNLNCTAVAELCDDSFEEHILEYEKDRAGLYIHGLNMNISEFKTYPFEAVSQFAEYFGFVQTPYTVVNEISELRDFLESCAETGSWKGMDIEGFVVRCQLKHRDAEHDASDYFFKYKFEEPYLMYRGWREVTKSMLAGQPIRIKKYKVATEAYLRFARNYFRHNPDLVNKYLQNHGIIALRNAFLKDYGLTGADIVKTQEEQGESDTERLMDTGAEDHKEDSSEVKWKYVLVPIATLGCGKTTVALALSELFGWGHIQNDNITGKSSGNARRFCKAVADSLEDTPVSIADRNNHMKRERAQIYSDMDQLMPLANIRYIALHFVHDGIGGKNAVRQITWERILARGDNHQSIQAKSDDRKKISSIMNGFLQRFQPLDMTAPPDKDMFDSVINLEVGDSLDAKLNQIIDSMDTQYPGLISHKPTQDEIHTAIEHAIAYIPATRKTFGSSGSVSGSLAPAKQQKQPETKKQPTQTTLNFSPTATAKTNSNVKPSASGRTRKNFVNYFALQVPDNKALCQKIEDAMLRKGADMSFWDQLKDSNRIQKNTHITLLHFSDIDVAGDMWLRYCERMDKKSLTDWCADVKCLAVVWDGRVLCVRVAVTPRPSESEGSGNDDELPLQEKLFHITIGTANHSIKPFESNALLRRTLSASDGNTPKGVHICSIADESIVLTNLHPEALK
ncbi:RNA ligase-domain-containing protein [Limtongia smithiae]|uniref:RNA ligase-domain-containing protein n=1 Tax=Limtongia smithiae TaxID=1125753 RepID=UPI0034CDC67B